jgi:hypothetical protein
VTDDGPAAIAGVRENDVIKTIDGVSVASKSIESLKSMILGVEGSIVTLGLIRAGSPDVAVVSVTRALPYSNTPRRTSPTAMPSVREERSASPMAPPRARQELFVDTNEVLDRRDRAQQRKMLNQLCQDLDRIACGFAKVNRVVNESRLSTGPDDAAEQGRDGADLHAGRDISGVIDAIKACVPEGCEKREVFEERLEAVKALCAFTPPEAMSCRWNDLAVACYNFCAPKRVDADTRSAIQKILCLK